MVITFISPRYGQGKTVTLINFANMILKKTKNDRVLIIDLNSGQSDIDQYLSNSHFTKGLDEFCNLHRLKMLNSRSFESSVKNVRKRLDIMAANTFEGFVAAIYANEVFELIKYTESRYEYVLVDTNNINNDVTNKFIEFSKLSVCVVMPEKKLLNKMLIKAEEKNFKNLFYVLNMFPSGEDLRMKADKNTKYFNLPYDYEIIKELNDDSIINYIMKNKGQNNSYYKNMENIIEEVMEINGATLKNKKNVNKKNLYKKKLGENYS